MENTVATVNPTRAIRGQSGISLFRKSAPTPTVWSVVFALPHLFAFFAGFFGTEDSSRFIHNNSFPHFKLLHIFFQ